MRLIFTHMSAFILLPDQTIYMVWKEQRQRGGWWSSRCTGAFNRVKLILLRLLCSVFCAVPNQSGRNDQMEPQIRVCQRPGNIYQKHRFQSTEISGRFGIPAEWFKKRRLSSEIQWWTVEKGVFVSARDQRCHRPFDVETDLRHAKNISVPTETENDLRLSLGVWSHRQTPPPPHTLPFSRTSALPPNPSSLQFVAAHPLSSRVNILNVLHMRST